MYPEWNAIHVKYGGKALYIEGTPQQPNSSFSFPLIYQGRNGFLTFSWVSSENTGIPILSNSMAAHTLRMVNDLVNDNPERYLPPQSSLYHLKTELKLELPGDKYYLEIHPQNRLHRMLGYFSSKKVSISPDFDARYITFAKPKSIISGIQSELSILVNAPWGSDFMLTTDYQDAVTTKFYLLFRTSNLFMTEELLEQQLSYCQQLIQKMYQY